MARHIIQRRLRGIADNAAAVLRQRGPQGEDVQRRPGHADLVQHGLVQRLMAVDKEVRLLPNLVCDLLVEPQIRWADVESAQMPAGYAFLGRWIGGGERRGGPKAAAVDVEEDIRRGVVPRGHDDGDVPPSRGPLDRLAAQQAVLLVALGQGQRPVVQAQLELVIGISQSQVPPREGANEDCEPWFGYRYILRVDVHPKLDGEGRLEPCAGGVARRRSGHGEGDGQLATVGVAPPGGRKPGRYSKEIFLHPGVDLAFQHRIAASRGVVPGGHLDAATARSGYVQRLADEGARAVCPSLRIEKSSATWMSLDGIAPLRACAVVRPIALLGWVAGREPGRDDLLAAGFAWVGFVTARPRVDVGQACNLLIGALRALLHRRPTQDELVTGNVLNGVELEHLVAGGER
mmetsp:Transcript_112265/g.324280  ORF Transcript_112265/g.324280 Transcript_112265/m.324280 type:complete len:404 (-) Transcript_112265:556-1767(-)